MSIGKISFELYSIQIVCRKKKTALAMNASSTQTKDAPKTVEKMKGQVVEILETAVSSVPNSIASIKYCCKVKDQKILVYIKMKGTKIGYINKIYFSVKKDEHVRYLKEQVDYLTSLVPRMSTL
jgi:hypothetical protein